MTSVVVYSSGPVPCPIMAVGEAPGRYEAGIGKPFVGPSGEILKMILLHCGDNAPYYKAGMYLTNLVKEYHDGNPDPTNDQIIYWGDHLRDEVELCQPKIILVVGRFAAWWFLGGWYKWGMRQIHGRPCRGGELFDSYELDVYPDERLFEEVYDGDSLNARCDRIEQDYHDRAQGAIVVPCYHPANALPDRDPKGDMMGTVFRDFDTAIRLYEKETDCRETYEQAKLDYPNVSMGGSLHGIPFDAFDDIENYVDATGEEFADYIYQASTDTNILAVDTEDGPDSPWSIQVCCEPACALTLRIDQPDYKIGITALQRAIDDGGLIILHFAIHDLPVMRELGLDTSRINLIDTSYMLYLLGEPQSLKVAQWRHCGMVSQEYISVVGDAGKSHQLRYLLDVVMQQYPKPGMHEITHNNGEVADYRPQSPSTKAGRIIDDLKKGIDVDIWDRWHTIAGSGQKAQVVKSIYRNVVDDLGPMPKGYLADVYAQGSDGRDRVINYACRDADATLRLHTALLPKLIEMGLA